MSIDLTKNQASFLVNKNHFFGGAGVCQNDYSITWGERVYAQMITILHRGDKIGFDLNSDSTALCTTPILCNSCKK